MSHTSGQADPYLTTRDNNHTVTSGQSLKGLANVQGVLHAAMCSRLSRLYRSCSQHAYLHGLTRTACPESFLPSVPRPAVANLSRMDSCPTHRAGKLRLQPSRNPLQTTSSYLRGMLTTISPSCMLVTSDTQRGRGRSSMNSCLPHVRIHSECGACNFSFDAGDPIVASTIPLFCVNSH